MAATRDSLNQLTQHGDWVTYIGYAAEDKVPDSHTLKVILPELTPFLQGDLKTEKGTFAIEVDDLFTTQKKHQVEATNTIIATWRNETNRTFPPDIKKGEQVKVTNYADQDIYYWEPYGRDDHLRRTERHRIDVANTQEMSKDHADDNTYFIEMDTRDKKTIIIQTSKSDGEPFAYTIRLDGKNGTMTFQDDDSNIIHMESAKPRIFIQNKKGTTVDLDMEDLFLTAIRDLKLKAGRQMVWDTPLVTGENGSGTGVTVLKGNGLTLDYKDVAIKSDAIGLDGAVVANTIVATDVQAEGYSTGNRGSQYVASTTDTANGTGSHTPNPPNTGGGGGGNRHAAAWEEVDPAFQRVANLFDEINIKLGLNLDTATIRSLATQSVMPKNRGE